MSPKSTKAAKANKKAAKTAPPPKKVEVEEESSESEEEEEVAAKAKKAPAKAVKKAAKQEEEDSDEESEEDSDEEEAAPPARNGKKAKAAEEDDDDDDDDDDSDEEEAPKKMEVDDDDDDDDDEDDSEDEESPPKKRKAPKEDKPAKKAKLEEDDSAVTLFVGGLPNEISDSEIQSFFVENGIKVASVRKHLKKPFAYVDLKKPKNLEKALALSGESLEGKEITIEKAKQKAEKEETKSPAKKETGGSGNTDKSDNDKLTLFVKNISYDASEEDLEAHFENATQVRWPKNHDGSKKGFAFIQFAEEDHVESAMSDLQGSDLCGRALLLDFVGAKSKGGQGGGGGRDGGAGGHRSSAEAGKTKTLIVKNLSWNTTEDSLADAFEGSTSARIVMRDGKSAGFGFVDFADESSCKSAADSMNDAEVDGRNVKVDFAAERGSGGGRGGGFRGGRGGFGGGRGGGGRGGFGGGRGGFGGRGGGRGGRGGFGGGRGGGGRGGGRGGFGGKRDGIRDFQGSKKTFD